MKESTNNRNTIIEDITEWWEFLDTSEKVAVVWLTIVGAILITLGAIFPIFGIILFGLCVFIGTIVSILHLISR